MSSDQSSALALVKKLRKYEEDHPVQAIAANFNPAYGAVSSGAAIADPEAPWWEKLLSAPGLIPGLGGASKATVILASRLRKYPKILEKAAKFIDPFTGKKMAEIDDSLAEFDLPFMEQAALNKIPMSLEDIYKHPWLYNAEPSMKDVGFSVGGVTAPGAVAEYRHGGPLPGRIHAKDIGEEGHETVDKFVDSVGHESQHVVDDYGGILDSGTTGSVIPGDSYWGTPAEIRARVTGQRMPFSAAGREKYPYDLHMMDEYSRLINRLRGTSIYGPDYKVLGEGTRAELDEALKGRGISYEDLLR